jgi:hypothetical protein
MIPNRAAARLAEYDRVVAEGRTRQRATHERCLAAELNQLDCEQLAPAEREKREREIRVKWWHNDFKADLDSRLRRDALIRDLDKIDEAATRLRRAEEALTIAHTESMMKIHRGPLLGQGRTPVSLARRFHRIRTERADGPEIPELRAQIDRWTRELGIHVRWTATPAVNAYAWQRTSEIEIAPIRSEAAFATAAHEIGHVACPCEPDHVRVPRKTRLGTVCVACELAAWYWAIPAVERTPHQWTREMHTNLADALPSYRDYATAPQQREIDELVSDLGFRRIQLHRRTGSQSEYGIRNDR